MENINMEFINIIQSFILLSKLSSKVRGFKISKTTNVIEGQ